MSAEGYDPAAADAELEAYLTGEQSTGSSWEPRDLGPALRGEVAPPTPSILRRSDGVGLLYAGELNGIHGESGSGKSWLMLLAAHEVVLAGGVVIWIDLEDPTEATIVERLRALGLSDERILAGVRYIAPQDPADLGAIGRVIDLVESTGAELVVIDSVGEAFALDGVSENADDEVAPWMQAVPRTIMRATGTTVVLVDHATKAGDAPLHPSGSKRKRAAVTGAQHLVTADPPFARDTPGRLVITCGKDRHGHHRRGDVVAEIQIRPTSTGGIAWTIRAPRPASVIDDDELVRTQEQAEALDVVNVLRRARRPLTRSDVNDRVRLRREAVSRAVARLVDCGAVLEHELVRANAAGARRAVIALRLADGTGWQPDDLDLEGVHDE